MLGAVFLVLAGPAVAQDAELAQQLQRIRRDLSDLQAYIYSGKTLPRQGSDPSASASAGGAASAAHLQVQIQSLETQMRDLTGRIEEVEHAVNVVKERVEKLVADVDLRLQALESGSGARPNKVGSRAGPGVAPETTAGGGRAAVANDLEPGQQVLGTLSRSGAKAVKPPLKSAPEATGGTAAAAEPGSQVAALTPGTPREQYDQAFRLLQARDYDKAATAFRGFVDGNPDSPLASNALYWLGETHYFRKDYAEAARVFLDGYKRYPKGNKAPDSLLKLGKSLAAIDEKKSACAAWNRLLKSFPKANKRLLANAKSERRRLGCT